MGFDGPWAFPPQQGEFEKTCGDCGKQVVMIRSKNDKLIPIEADTRYGHKFEERGTCTKLWTNNPQNKDAKRNQTSAATKANVEQIMVNQQYMMEALNDILKHLGVEPTKMVPEGDDVPF